MKTIRYVGAVVFNLLLEIPYRAIRLLWVWWRVARIARKLTPAFWRQRQKHADGETSLAE